MRAASQRAGAANGTNEAKLKREKKTRAKAKKRSASALLVSARVFRYLAALFFWGGDSSRRNKGFAVVAAETGQSRIERMQFALAFAALLCCVLCALAAKKGKLAKSKIAQIQEAAPVLALTDSNFKKYITDRPREYHSVLMLTATDPKYRCTICQRAKNALVDAAKSYHAQFSFNTSSISERIAFFTVEVDDAPNLFNELRVETVPHVYVLPPADEQSKKTSLPSYEVDTKAYMEGLSSIFAQLAAVTGVKVKALIDPWPAIIFASLVAIVIALFMSVASYGFFNALLSYQSPAIWRVVSMVSLSAEAPWVCTPARRCFLLLVKFRLSFFSAVADSYLRLLLPWPSVVECDNTHLSPLLLSTHMFVRLPCVLCMSRFASESESVAASTVSFMDLPS